ncbi:E3 ubiquitin-protein ligase XB3-like [Rosa chinensis]|uniref:E3 ubiquitin-protein ligase XB3-like n=1 Tax=Rosa chinensis TaxID=74649 RepID=UPI001AD903FC|nr:E3 ubiquitin-protein ligase XB3-like [Rosa chinensis]
MLNPSSAEPLVWPSPLKFISELNEEAKALLEQALTEANKEREKNILKGSGYSLASPSHSDVHSDIGMDDNLSECIMGCAFLLSSDGAASLVLVSGEKALELGLHALVLHSSGKPTPLVLGRWELPPIPQLMLEQEAESLPHTNRSEARIRTEASPPAPRRREVQRSVRVDFAGDATTQILKRMQQLEQKLTRAESGAPAPTQNPLFASRPGPFTAAILQAIRPAYTKTPKMSHYG